VKACRRREFFPYLGFSPLWPKISRRLIPQSSLRLKAAKPMARDSLIVNFQPGKWVDQSVPKGVTPESNLRFGT
jgi:hypothetical protein